MTIEWDNQGLSENFTDIELGEQVDTAPLREAREERREHLIATIVGQVNGVMRPVVEGALEELLKLEKGL